MAHVLIYGSDHLAYRIAEQVRAEGFIVSIIARSGSWLASAGIESNASGLCIQAFLSDDGTTTTLLQTAGIEQVETFFAVSDVDEGNLGLALAALELNTNLRVVLRQFNMRLGLLLEEYLPRCDVMSMSALAAPTFALAACTAAVRFAHNIGKDTLVLREENVETPSPMKARAGRVVVALERDKPHWFPTADRVFAANTKLLIASTANDLPSHPLNTRTRLVRKPVLTWRTQRILFGVTGYLAFVVVCASVYFYLRLGMGALNSLYFVITTITSVGFGDFSLRDADPLSKVIGMLLMLSGVGITAVFFALITNSLVAHQYAFEQGRVRQRISDHTIVCGLGVVGLRVAEKLHQLGAPVVCVEKDEDGRLVAEARRLGIPIVIGSALQEQTLRYANIEQARSLVVCSNPDHLNLEIALNARSLRRDLPIVLRMFDPDLARRVASHFKLDTTFSSAALVAPFFAAQATGSSRLFSLDFNELSIDFHHLKNSDGEDVARIVERYHGRLVAVIDDAGRLRFDVEDSDSFKPDSIVVMESAA
jgi:Trk K+ transport system NAD-binding subunit